MIKRSAASWLVIAFQTLAPGILLRTRLLAGPSWLPQLAMPGENALPSSSVNWTETQRACCQSLELQLSRAAHTSALMTGKDLHMLSPSHRPHWCYNAVPTVKYCSHNTLRCTSIGIRMNHLSWSLVGSQSWWTLTVVFCRCQRRVTPSWMASTPSSNAPRASSPIERLSSLQVFPVPHKHQA